MYKICNILVHCKPIVILILIVYIYRAIKLPGLQKALSKVGRGTGRGRGAGGHGWGGSRITRSTYDNGSPLDSTPDIEDISPVNVEEKESDVKKEKTTPQKKPIIKTQKARRGKSFHGGSVNIRKLQNARVCIEKSKCSEEQLDQEIKGKVEESNKEETSDETKENEKQTDEGKNKKKLEEKSEEKSEMSEDKCVKDSSKNDKKKEEKEDKTETNVNEETLTAHKEEEEIKETNENKKPRGFMQSCLNETKAFYYFLIFFIYILVIITVRDIRIYYVIIIY